jgi:hypothetical protein
LKTKKVRQKYYFYIASGAAPCVAGVLPSVVPSDPTQAGKHSRVH